ncbi:MAG TPA: glycosyltransferase [bacterium]|nr:glycosyltransferase [bacterium]
MKVSIVIGSYDRKRFLKLAIESVREECRDIEHEIIVVDGGSTDGSLKWLCAQKDIIAILQHNRGEWEGRPVRRRSWGYFMNLGFKCAQGKYICMLSDDCLVVPGAIRNGIELFERSLAEGRRVGAVAFYWRNWPEMKKYWVGLTLGRRMFVNHGLYLNDAMKDVGYCDEETLSFYHGDGDLSLKMWHAGREIIAGEDSYVEHYSHANMRARASNLALQKDDWERYLRKWTGIFYDPAKGDIGDWIEKEMGPGSGIEKRFERMGLLWW